MELAVQFELPFSIIEKHLLPGPFIHTTIYFKKIV